MPQMPPTNALEQGVRKSLGYLWDKYTQAMEQIGPGLDAYDMATRGLPQQVPPGLGQVAAYGVSGLDEAVRAPMAMAAGMKGLQKIFKWAEIPLEGAGKSNADRLMEKENKINKALDFIAKKFKANPISGNINTYDHLGELFDKWSDNPVNEGKTVEDFLKTVNSEFIAQDIIRKLKRTNPDAVAGINIADDVAEAVGKNVKPSPQLASAAPSHEQVMISAQEAPAFVERVARAGGQQAIENVKASPAAHELNENLGTLDRYYKRRAESLNYRVGTKGVPAPQTGGAELARQLNLNPATIRHGDIPTVPEAQVFVAQASKAPVLQDGQWLKSRLRNIPLQFQEEAAKSMGDKVGSRVLRWAQGNYKVSDAARMSGMSADEMLSHLNTFYGIATDLKLRHLANNPITKNTRKPWTLPASTVKNIKE